MLINYDLLNVLIELNFYIINITINNQCLSIHSVCVCVLSFSHFTHWLADIFDILFEGQQFEAFGYVLPLVLKTAIMKKEMLYNDFEAVYNVVHDYNALLNRLTLSEVKCVLVHLQT